MKIVFMGTPDFASEQLSALIKGGYEVTLVITQPDKPKGRSGEKQKSPVKLMAEKFNIPVFQPVKIRDAASVEELKKYDADIFVVAAFGQILSEEILNMPRFGCINIHASLLPEYRGAAPIQWAILDGQKKTGITIQQMDKGVDTGDILLKKELEIGDEDTGGELFTRLTHLGAESLLEVLPLIESGNIKPQPQDEAKATYAKKISKDMGLIDWNLSAGVIERYIRGLDPWPSAFTYLNGKSLKIWKAGVGNMTPMSESATASGACGTVTGVDKDSFTVRCGKGELKVFEVQLEGKKRMQTKDFLLGNRLCAGDKLG